MLTCKSQLSETDAGLDLTTPAWQFSFKPNDPTTTPHWKVVRESADNEAALAALQTYACYHLVYHHSHCQPRDALDRRLKTIKLINARLANPEQAFSNATIAAVCLVAIADIDMASFPQHQEVYSTESVVHLRGCLLMIAMRGGPSLLPDWIEWIYHW